MLERCQFFEANINHAVLCVQIFFFLDCALQQKFKTSARQHMDIHVCRSSTDLAEVMKIQQTAVDRALQELQGRRAMAFALVDRTVARGCLGTGLLLCLIVSGHMILHLVPRV